MKKYAIIMIALIQKCPRGLKKILKYNPGEKSLKAPFAVYLDLKCLLKKEQSRENNNIEKSYTEKKAKQLNLLVGQCLQNFHLMKKKQKLGYCRRNNCIKKLSKKLKKCAIKIIIHGKKRNDTIDL